MQVKRTQGQWEFPVTHQPLVSRAKMHCLTKRARSSVMVQEVVSQRFSLCTFAQLFEPPRLRETEAFRHWPPGSLAPLHTNLSSHLVFGCVS